MRKWILVASMIAALAGGLVGVIAGTYLGFHTSHRWHGSGTFEQRIVDVSIANSYWVSALDGTSNEIRNRARMQALVNAQVVAWIYEYLDEFQQDRAKRAFGKLL